MSKRKYWYRITREWCEGCGKKIGESRRRAYNKEEAEIVDIFTPQCDYCYRVMKGV